MKTITEENFETEVINAGKPVVLDFFATWCGPCKALHPILLELEREHPELIFAELDVDEAPRIAARYQVMSIPTVKTFVNGEVKGSMVGLTSKQAALDNILQAVQA